jgi:hypothetical protein
MSHTPAADMAPDAPPLPGAFSWHELATTDPEGGWTFYSALFGWEKMGEFDMGPSGLYREFGYGGQMVGGIYLKPAQTPVSNWLPYARVSSADDAAAAAGLQGGTVILGPMEVPGGDRIAVMRDPQGAVFAVHAAKA